MSVVAFRRVVHFRKVRMYVSEVKRYNSYISIIIQTHMLIYKVYS